jgi:hypothetical protein
VDRRRSIIFAAAGVGAAVALLLVGRAGPSSTELQSAAAELDGRIRETAAAALVRAQTLAQLPRMSWAVATDEQTMLDLTADELAFQPAPGELIEIGQVQRRDGNVTSLRRVGDVAVFHLPLSDPGQHLMGGDGRLHVVAVVSVEPKTRGDQLRGAVAVSRLVDVSGLAAKLGKAGLALRLDVPGGGGVVIGPPAANARVVGLPLYADAARGAKLSALLSSGGAPGAWWVVGAIVALAVGGGGAAWMWRRGGARARAQRWREEAPLPELVQEVHVDLKER